MLLEYCVGHIREREIILFHQDLKRESSIEMDAQLPGGYERLSRPAIVLPAPVQDSLLR